MASVRQLFAWTAFPLLLAGALAWALALLAWGAPPPLAFLAPKLGVFAIVIACERIFPHHAEWNRAHGDLGTDAGHAVVSNLVTPALVRPLLHAGAIAVAGAASRLLGGTLWPTTWPLLVQLALALVVAEFFMYWLHRWQHEKDWLWRFHATHHSAPRLYWLNAGRFHPIDIALVNLAWYGPLVVLGCGEAVIALFTLVAGVHGVFQHANVEVRIGPLNWIFSMAELHRWHHSRRLREANRNYGQNLILWDVVFGTRYLPADREAPTEVGIAGLPAFPTTYFAQLASPFRWRRIRDDAGYSR